MHPARITKLASAVHAALAAAAVYYALRINNHADLTAISAKEAYVMLGIVLLPVASAWTGLRLARTNAAHWLMATGQTLALILFAATFGLVVTSVEPMAPLLFILVSMWIAAGLAVLMPLVWLTSRRTPADA
ncbi:MAG: hypothetical protein K2Y42_07835 [Hyphomicrobium sp.]|jgi:hypothetical protein|uniref:hypothetical protein n=1 Tax=Hyphomicrobium sp. TaxID=82 RepID=UPI0025C088C5|nr:hypothetical protein [Hyphomicrobium sp.]MBX9862649.1 hypothetical protein [Hyphomicrobium sp.]